MTKTAKNEGVVLLDGEVREEKPNYLALSTA